MIENNPSDPPAVRAAMNRQQRVFAFVEDADDGLLETGVCPSDGLDVTALSVRIEAHRRMKQQQMEE